jgi:hypothetical protein
MSRTSDESAMPDATVEPAVRVQDTTMMPIVLLTLFSSQALVVTAALALPVLAPEVAASYGIEARWIGYYAALVYGAAMLAALATPGAVRRHGALRVNQITLLLAGLTASAGAMLLRD